MNKSNFKKGISLYISHIKTKAPIIYLLLMCFAQIASAEDSIQKNDDDILSKCSVMEMKGNVMLKADLATVYTDKQDRTVVLLPKTKKNTILLESDTQKCIASPLRK